MFSVQQVKEHFKPVKAIRWIAALFIWELKFTLFFVDLKVAKYRFNDWLTSGLLSIIVIGVSLSARYQANWSAARMILPAWFDHLVKSFPDREVQSKYFCLPVKTHVLLLKTLMKPLIVRVTLTRKHIPHWLLLAVQFGHFAIVLFHKISILPPTEGIGISWGGGEFCKAKKFKEMYEV